MSKKEQSFNVEHQLMDMYVKADQPDLLQDTFSPLEEALEDEKTARKKKSVAERELEKATENALEKLHKVAADLEEQSHSDIAPRNILMGHITLSNLINQYLLQHGRDPRFLARTPYQDLDIALAIFDKLKGGEPVVSPLSLDDSRVNAWRPEGIMAEDAQISVFNNNEQGSLQEISLEYRLPYVHATVLVPFYRALGTHIARKPEKIELRTDSLRSHSIVVGRTAVAAFFEKMQFKQERFPTNIPGIYLVDNRVVLDNAHRLASIFQENGIDMPVDHLTAELEKAEVATEVKQR